MKEDSGEWQRRVISQLSGRLNLLVFVMLFLTVAVGSLVLWLGGRELEASRNDRVDRVYMLSDGVLTKDEFDRTTEILAADSASGRCDVARSNYERTADIHLPHDTPTRVRVSDEVDAVPGGTSCIIFEERHSAPAGLSVLTTTALAAVSTLLSLVAFWLARGARRNSWIAAGAIALLTVVMTIAITGRYRFESHLLVTMLPVSCVLAPTIAALLHTATATNTSQPASPGARLKALNDQRAEVRAATLILSVLLSITTALAATLNQRFIATEGQLNFRLLGKRIGGFMQSDVAAVTALSGLAYTTIIAVVTIPAIIRIESNGRQLLAEFFDSDPQATDLDAPGPAEGDEEGRVPTADMDGTAQLIARESTAQKLGLETRPLAWIERALVVALPIITGATANILNLAA